MKSLTSLTTRVGNIITIQKAHGGETVMTLYGVARKVEGSTNEAISVELDWVSAREIRKLLE